MINDASHSRLDRCRNHLMEQQVVDSDDDRDNFNNHICFDCYVCEDSDR